MLKFGYVLWSEIHPMLYVNLSSAFSLLRIIRSGRFSKDKIGIKFYAAGRSRGAILDFVHLLYNRFSALFVRMAECS